MQSQRTKGQRMKVLQVCIKQSSHIQPFTWNLEHPRTLCYIATSPLCSKLQDGSWWQLSPMAMRTSMLSRCCSASVLLSADDHVRSCSIHVVALRPHPKTKKTQHSCLKRALLNSLSLSRSLLSAITLTLRDACRQ